MMIWHGYKPVRFRDKWSKHFSGSWSPFLYDGLLYKRTRDVDVTRKSVVQGTAGKSAPGIYTFWSLIVTEM